jgi:DNA-binding FrmR family transcriptional regulator
MANDGRTFERRRASMSVAKKLTHVVEDELALDDFVKRIRRAEGQMGGILRMVEDGRSCEDIVNQLAAVSKAIDKAAFSLISAGLKECLTDGKKNHEEVSAQLQKLFMTMA